MLALLPVARLVSDTTAADFEAPIVTSNGPNFQISEQRAPSLQCLNVAANERASFMQKILQTFLTGAGTWMARPAAFGLVVVYVALWLIYDRESFNFHGAVAVITLCMTLFIQRSEHRDTQAIQAKLDELLRTQADARQSLTRLDEQQPEQIEAHRAAARAQD
jgi:low affinity Fe/Cu permease